MVHPQTYAEDHMRSRLEIATLIGFWCATWLLVYIREKAIPPDCAEVSYATSSSATQDFSCRGCILTPLVTRNGPCSELLSNFAFSVFRFPNLKDLGLIITSAVRVTGCADYSWL